VLGPTLICRVHPIVPIQMELAAGKMQIIELFVLSRALLDEQSFEGARVGQDCTLQIPQLGSTMRCSMLSATLLSPVNERFDRWWRAVPRRLSTFFVP